MKTINEVQEIQFRLMNLASFNNFDGAMVVKSLRANRELWKGCVFGRFGYGDLICLRDMCEDYWNVNTLMILVEPGHEDDLFRLAGNWKADEIDWLSDTKAVSQLGTSQPGKVLRVWWD